MILRRKDKTTYKKKINQTKVILESFLIKQNTILTNDPSMTAWGWGILTFSVEIIELGCIKTKTEGKKRRIRKGDETTARISEINKILLELIRKYNVTYILSELPHGSQNAAAAVMIGVVAGIAQTIADTLDIGIEWFSEGDSKKCLLGKISATKQETIDAIDQIYAVPWTNIKWRDEAIADALSIHYCATKQSSSLKLLKQK